MLMVGDGQDNRSDSAVWRGERIRDGEVDIHDRTFALAVRVLRLVRALPNDMAGRTVARQLSRSGTSVGANVEEAQGGYSRAEFARRMGIARSEARETLYWLRLIRATELMEASRLGDITREAEEVARILTSIVKAARRPKAASESEHQQLAIRH